MPLRHVIFVHCCEGRQNGHFRAYTMTAAVTTRKARRARIDEPVYDEFPCVSNRAMNTNRGATITEMNFVNVATLKGHTGIASTRR